MVKVIKAEFQGSVIQFDDNGWFNATVAAARFNKSPRRWLELKETSDYITALCFILNVDQNDIIKTKKGKGGGSWFHPKLAVNFARWCDATFAIWCDMQIEEIIHGKPEQQDWKKLRHEAASSYKVMSDVLHDVRSDEGKETKFFHYANEAKLVNWAITGEFKPLDRENLSERELDVLAKLETRNSVMLAKGASREVRKEVLQAMAESMMNIKLEEK